MALNLVFEPHHGEIKFKDIKVPVFFTSECEFYIRTYSSTSRKEIFFVEEFNSSYFKDDWIPAIYYLPFYVKGRPGILIDGLVDTIDKLFFLHYQGYTVINPENYSQIGC